MKLYRYILFPGLFLLSFLFACQKQEQTPNIVLIMADDMGYECLSCNGSTEYKTPDLDKLAEEGIRFEHCYSQPLCTPSRVKIMTGKYNFRNYEDFGYLNPNEITFGNLLKDAGYSTCIAGKWQLNGLNRNNPGNQDVDRPYHFGFDEYCLWQLNRKKAEGERYANPLITVNGKDLPRDENAYGPQIFADYICDFIDRKAGQPFFVYYPMVLVHEPFVPTPDSPEWRDKSRRYENDTTYFSDMVAFTDKMVGQIISKLNEKGIWDNTLFIFTGDNGTGRAVYSKTNLGTVKGGKGLSIITGNHVPLIVNWPARMKGERAMKSIVSFCDVLPTFSDAAVINPGKYSSDGISWLPLITGEKEDIQDEIFIHYSPRWGNFEHSRWVMNDTFKLYKNGNFYNTVKDTLEKDPLLELSEKEQKIKDRFQLILADKEAEVPFEQNDKAFNLSH